MNKKIKISLLSAMILGSTLSITLPIISCSSNSNKIIDDQAITRIEFLNSTKEKELIDLLSTADTPNEMIKLGNEIINWNNYFKLYRFNGEEVLNNPISNVNIQPKFEQLNQLWIVSAKLTFYFTNENNNKDNINTKEVDLKFTNVLKNVSLAPGADSILSVELINQNLTSETELQKWVNLSETQIFLKNLFIVRDSNGQINNALKYVNLIPSPQYFNNLNSKTVFIEPILNDEYFLETNTNLNNEINIAKVNIESISVDLESIKNLQNELNKNINKIGQDALINSASSIEQWLNDLNQINFIKNLFKFSQPSLDANCIKTVTSSVQPKQGGTNKEYTITFLVVLENGYVFVSGLTGTTINITVDPIPRVMNKAIINESNKLTLVNKIIEKINKNEINNDASEIETWANLDAQQTFLKGLFTFNSSDVGASISSVETSVVDSNLKTGKKYNFTFTIILTNGFIFNSNELSTVELNNVLITSQIKLTDNPKIYDAQQEEFVSKLISEVDKGVLNYRSLEDVKKYFEGEAQKKMIIDLFTFELDSVPVPGAQVLESVNTEIVQLPVPSGSKMRIYNFRFHLNLSNKYIFIDDYPGLVVLGNVRLFPSVKITNAPTISVDNKNEIKTKIEKMINSNNGVPFLNKKEWIQRWMNEPEQQVFIKKLFTFVDGINFENIKHVNVEVTDVNPVLNSKYLKTQTIIPPQLKNYNFKFTIELFSGFIFVTPGANILNTQIGINSKGRVLINPIAVSNASTQLKNKLDTYFTTPIQNGGGYPTNNAATITTYLNKTEHQEFLKTLFNFGSIENPPTITKITVSVIKTFAIPSSNYNFKFNFTLDDNYVFDKDAYKTTNINNINIVSYITISNNLGFSNYPERDLQTKINELIGLNEITNDKASIENYINTNPEMKKYIIRDILRISGQQPYYAKIVSFKLVVNDMTVGSPPPTKKIYTFTFTAKLNEGYFFMAGRDTKTTGNIEI